MITRLNKKIEQKDKNDDFKPILYIVITLIATMITCSLLMSFKASAYDLDYGGWAGWRNDTTAYFSGGQLNFRDAGAGNVESITPGSVNLGVLSSLNLCTNSTIPANSIISIPFEFAGNSSGNTQYPQASISANSWDYSVISTSYGEYGSSWILLYTDIEIKNCNLWLSVSLPYTMNYYSIKITAGNWVKLKDIENWSSADKQHLFNRLNDIAGATSNSSNTLYSILEQLRGEQQQAEEQTQEASEEGQTNADGSQTDNEGASQNVIGVIGNVISAFNTPAGDCSYNVDLGNLDLGNLNFCSGKPPEFAGLINMAGSIIIVYACYRVARTVFRIWLAMSVFAQGSGKGKTD